MHAGPDAEREEADESFLMAAWITPLELPLKRCAVCRVKALRCRAKGSEQRWYRGRQTSFGFLSFFIPKLTQEQEGTKNFYNPFLVETLQPKMKLI